MSKQKQSKEIQADPKRQQKVEPPVSQMQGEAAELAQGSFEAPQVGAVGSQAAMLKRMSPAQAQAMLKRANRTQGNQHAQRVVAATRSNTPAIQAQLAVSQPGDEYEQEADTVAEKVMTMSAPSAPPALGEEETPAVSRLPISRAQVDGEESPGVSPDVESRIDSMKGGGKPIPADDRGFFEERMGADFSGVRIHTDAGAAETAKDLDARAYTVGSDVAFNAGEYEPGTDKGKRLLAHELTHVVQQGASKEQVARRPKGPDAERETKYPPIADYHILLDNGGAKLVKEFTKPVYYNGEFPLIKAPDKDDLVTKTSNDANMDVYIYKYTHLAPLAGWGAVAHICLTPKLLNNPYAVIKQLNSATTLAKDEVELVVDKLDTISEMGFKDYKGMDPDKPDSDEIKEEANIEHAAFNLSPYVTKQIKPNSVASRYEFVQHMRLYLGSIDAVIEHFGKGSIRQAKVPGTVILHKDAASRIEGVKNTLESKGLAMPASWVGLGLRGRYKAHKLRPKSMMGHPMGYAVDYRVAGNPQIKDKNIRAFLDVQTDKARYFSNLGVSHKERRKLITEMGDATISPDCPTAGFHTKKIQFLAALESEFDRVSQASAGFGKSLGFNDPNSAEYDEKKTAEFQTYIKELRAFYYPLDDTFTKFEARERKGSLTKKQKIELDKIRAQIQTKIKEAKPKLTDYFQPWLQKLAQTRQTMEDKTPILSNLAWLQKKMADLQDQRARVESEEEILPKVEQTTRIETLGINPDGSLRIRRTTPPPPLSIEEQLAILDKRIAEFETDITMVELEADEKSGTQYARWKHLGELSQMVVSDFHFLLGKKEKVAIDPGVMQLMERGYFTPDKEPGTSTPNSDKHGFNFEFMKAMAEHGFDLGVAWKSFTDPMHFELAAAVDGLPAKSAMKDDHEQVKKRVYPTR